jgi:hypothetical protein
MGIDAGRVTGTDGGRVGSGVTKLVGIDGSVVLVLFPDCEIVIVVGGIPAGDDDEDEDASVNVGSIVLATLARAAFAVGSVSV